MKKAKGTLGEKAKGNRAGGIVWPYWLSNVFLGLFWKPASPKLLPLVPPSRWSRAPRACSWSQQKEEYRHRHHHHEEAEEEKEEAEGEEDGAEVKKKKEEKSFIPGACVEGACIQQLRRTRDCVNSITTMTRSLFSFREPHDELQPKPCVDHRRSS